METKTINLPPHLQSLAAKLQKVWDAKTTITDVTPEGYGPDEVTEPPPCEHLTTEQQRLRRAINEGQTILRGRAIGARREQIERVVQNAKNALGGR